MLNRVKGMIPEVVGLLRGWVTGGHRQERLKFAGEGGTTLRADYRYSEAPVTKQHTEEQDVSRRGPGM